MTDNENPRQVVVTLPEPAWDNGWTVGLYVVTAEAGEVSLEWGDETGPVAEWSAETARALFEAGLAACDAADRMAAESGEDGAS